MGCVAILFPGNGTRKRAPAPAHTPLVCYLAPCPWRIRKSSHKRIGLGGPLSKLPPAIPQLVFRLARYKSYLLGGAQCLANGSELGGLFPPSARASAVK